MILKKKDCCNKKSNIPNFIMLLMEDIWKLFQDINIYNCCYIYKETNKIIDCLTKKCICNIESTIWWLNFPKYVIKFGFKYYYDSSFNQI